ncbi:C40 family peptidase [Nocardia sp. NPDC004722]
MTARKQRTGGEIRISVLDRLKILFPVVVVTIMAANAIGPDRDPAPVRGGPVHLIEFDTPVQELEPLRAWAQVRAEKYDIPVRALQAYGFATMLIEKARPGCHLGWTTLAGIASADSDHGRSGGAAIADDGLVRPPIRGIALDNAEDTAMSLDTDVATGVTAFARAMGPFRFVPEKWNRWGLRANTDSDALADTLKTGNPVAAKELSGTPDNIDDAALAVGRHLCAAGGDLATADGWQRAILAYNTSTVYLDQVRITAAGYDGGDRRQASGPGWSGARTVAAAESQIGVEYAWGGGTLIGPDVGIPDGGIADSFGDTDKIGWDCSGLARFAVYAATGEQIPRTSQEQSVSGDPVDLGQAQPGDLVFFGGDGVAHHVGVYIGGDLMIHAPYSGARVRTQSITEFEGPYTFRRFL